MKVSDGLLYQANQFSRTRSFSLNNTLKDELAKIYYDLGHGVLNKQCATCVRIAMDRLNYELLRGELPALCQNIDVKPTVHFIGVKQKTFNELRTEAKEKGFKATRTTTREDIETFLKND
jgi:hypothetical protein